MLLFNEASWLRAVGAEGLVIAVIIFTKMLLLASNEIELWFLKVVQILENSI